MLWLFFVTLLPCATPLDGSGKYYGAEYGGYPNYQERAALAFTNAVRADPWNYKYLHASDFSPSLLVSNVLNTAIYPAQPPLYYNYMAGVVARGHSIDMSHYPCFSHPDCNGTCIWTRLDAVTNTCPIDTEEGENIAAGNSDPRVTVNQWLCDDNQCTGNDVSCSCGQTGSICCPDNSTTCSCDNDGHRKNIMSSGYNITGYGFDDTGCGPQQSCNATTCCYVWYWTEDFYGSQTAVCLGPSNYIYSGSHLAGYNTTGTTWFGAQYYDPTGHEPLVAEVNIENTCTPLKKELGLTAGMGSYSVMLPVGSACRNYQFHFRSNAGVDYYHPEQGVLVTYGEGTGPSCATAWANTTLTACPGTTYAPVAPSVPTTAVAPSPGTPSPNGGSPSTPTPPPTPACDIDAISILLVQFCGCVSEGSGQPPLCTNPTCGVQGCSTNVDAFITCVNSMNLQGGYPAAVTSLKQCSTLGGAMESAPISAFALVIAGLFGLVL